MFKSKVNRYELQGGKILQECSVTDTPGRTGGRYIREARGQIQYIREARRQILQGGQETDTSGKPGDRYFRENRGHIYQGGLGTDTSGRPGDRYIREARGHQGGQGSVTSGRQIEYLTNFKIVHRDYILWCQLFIQ